MTLYTTPTCPMCKVAKVKLNAAGFSYKICQDEEVMKEKNIKSVPVLEDDYGQMLNFSEIMDMVREAVR